MRQWIDDTDFVDNFTKEEMPNSETIDPIPFPHSIDFVSFTTSM